MNGKSFHNFIIVGASKAGKVQKTLLIEIATELYSRAIGGVVHINLLEKQFLAINTPLADVHGYVITGQILYLPSVKPVDSDEVITQELKVLNDMVLHKLDNKGKSIHGRRHHLLSTMVASTGLSTEIGIDLRKSYLKLAQEHIANSLRKISFYAKSARTLKSSRALSWGQDRIGSELKDLELGSAKYLNYANTTDSVTRMDVQAATGIQWNRMIYDVKRVGIDRASIKMMSRHLSATIRMASKVRHLGKFAIALSAGEAVYETGEVCRREPWGTACYDEAFRQSGGLGSAYVGAKLTEKIVERFGGTEKTCNLILDEADGIGLPVCNIILPAALSIGSGLIYSHIGKVAGGKVYTSSYYLIHKHRVKLD